MIVPMRQVSDEEPSKEAVESDAQDKERYGESHIVSPWLMIA